MITSSTKENWGEDRTMMNSNREHQQSLLIVFINISIVYEAEQVDTSLLYLYIIFCSARIFVLSTFSLNRLPKWLVPTSPTRFHVPHGTDIVWITSFSLFYVLCYCLRVTSCPDPRTIINQLTLGGFCKLSFTQHFHQYLVSVSSLINHQSISLICCFVIIWQITQVSSE